MGLDLILYRKDIPIENSDSELAYGRKTWAIANFFRKRCKPIKEDYYYKVTEQDWNDFINSLEDLDDPSFRAKVEKFLTINPEVNKEYDDLYEEIEWWLDNVLENDNFYVLGLDWELRAVIDWYESDERVREAFEDGAPVELIVSY